MKEVIEGKIFWRLNEKSVAYEAATAWYKVIPCNIFQNTNPIVFVLFIYLFFELMYQIGYQRQYFGVLNLKMLAYEANILFT